MSKSKVNARESNPVYQAIKSADSIRAAIFTACDSGFKRAKVGSTFDVSPRSQLFQGARLAMDDYTMAMAEANAVLNAALAKAGDDVQAKDIAKGAFSRTKSELNSQKNKDLGTVRIYVAEWLKGVQHPTINSGVKPRLSDMRFSLGYDNNTDTLSLQLIGANEGTGSKAPKAGKGTGTKKPVSKIRSKAAPAAKPTEKGTDSTSKAYGAEAALDDCYANLKVDPTDKKLQDAFSKALTNYRKEWEAAQKKAEAA